MGYFSEVLCLLYSWVGILAVMIVNSTVIYSVNAIPAFVVHVAVHQIFYRCEGNVLYGIIVTVTV